MPLPSVRVLLLACLLVPSALWAEQLETRLQPERSQVLAGSKVRLGAVLTLKAPVAAADARSAAVDLALVLDRSYSMKEAGKIEMVYVAGPDLVDRLESDDRLGIVTFCGTSETIRPLVNVNDVEGIKRLIRQVHLGSATNVGAGLQNGLDLFTVDGRSAAKRLLLLSDGQTNTGERNVQVLSKWAKEAFTQRGLRVSTVGLGASYDERFLAQIAHAGGGEFYYVSKREELPALFRKELEEGRHVTVSDLVITAHEREGGRLLELVGFPFTGGDERHREVKLGDLFAKETRSLLLYFEITVPDRVTGAGWIPAELELTWKDVDQKPQRAMLPLNLESTFEESKVADSLDKKVHARVVETENYRAMDQAMKAFRDGDREKAVELLKEAEKRASDEAVVNGDARLLEQAGRLAQTRREVEGLVEERDAQIYNTGASLFGTRSRGSRQAAVKRSGGSSATESSVDMGLRWLHGHQADDGSWDTASTGGVATGRQDGTVLALLAFLGAGHTEGVGQYKQCVGKAVGWLKKRQQEDGFVGRTDGVLEGDLASFRRTASHALATMALCEAAGMAKEPATKKSAQLALDWLAEQRPLGKRAERLKGVDGIGDEDILGVFWCVSALKSGKVAELRVPQSAFEEARLFLKRAEVRGDGGPGHRFRFFSKDLRTPRPLDTACGLACRQFLGYKRSNLYPGVAWLAKQPKSLAEWGTDGEAFKWRYAYLANLVFFQTGGESWQTWNGNLKAIMATEQNRDGTDRGSWSPVGTLKGQGKVFSTAFGSLYLEVYYRYLPMYR